MPSYSFAAPSIPPPVKITPVVYDKSESLDTPTGFVRREDMDYYLDSAVFHYEVDCALQNQDFYSSPTTNLEKKTDDMAAKKVSIFICITSSISVRRAGIRRRF